LKEKVRRAFSAENAAPFSVRRKSATAGTVKRSLAGFARRANGGNLCEKKCDRRDRQAKLGGFLQQQNGGRTTMFLK